MRRPSPAAVSRAHHIFCFSCFPPTRHDGPSLFNFYLLRRIRVDDDISLARRPMIQVRLADDPHDISLIYNLRKRIRIRTLSFAHTHAHARRHAFSLTHTPSALYLISRPLYLSFLILPHFSVKTETDLELVGSQEWFCLQIDLTIRSMLYLFGMRSSMVTSYRGSEIRTS